MSKRDLFAPFRASYAAEEQKHNGPKFWRSLEHKHGEETLVDAMSVEFPNGTAELPEMQRRDVLKLAGATFALGGLSACIRRPEDEILPYTKQPEEVIPGIPNYYATAMPRPDGALGIVAEAHEGRPTKLEGNALHPSSGGAADVWAQSEVLKMYDPDRSRSPRKDMNGGDGTAGTWADWDTFAKGHFASFAGNGGQGLAFVVDDAERPTLDRLLALAKQKLPNARVYRWDTLSADHAQQGAELAFGPGARVHHDLEKAKVIFALDSNFLVQGPDHVRLARGFGKGRRIKSRDEAGNMNRLYVAEGVFSETGANAEHRLQLASSLAPDFLKALAAELAGKHGVSLAELAGSATAPTGTEKFLAALAADLVKNRGASVVLVGERQPAAVHALAAAINIALGAADTQLQTVTQVAGAPARESVAASVASLSADLDADKVSTLVILDVNLAFAAPGALKLAEKLKKAKTVVHAGHMVDETARLSTWHLPLAHFLETWGDARGWDGSTAIVQPLILPLFGARADTQIVAQAIGLEGATDKSLVEETWHAAGMPLADNKAWRRALHDGIIPATARPIATIAPQSAQIAAELGKLAAGKAPTSNAVELVLTTGHIYDGRLGNNSWNQELPDDMTKLCWDNALIVSPALANKIGLGSNVKRNSYKSAVVAIEANGVKLEVPSFVLPGLEANTVSLHLGYGRKAGGVAADVGVDAFALMGADGSRVISGAKIVPTGAFAELASTQDHFATPANPMHELTFAQMSAAAAGSEDRNLVLTHGRQTLVRRGSLKQYTENPKVFHEGDIPENLVAHGTPAHQPSRPLQPINDITYDGQQWGMVIDLTACIGCNACAIACQAENNIPSVGRKQVLLGREMHWMRIDRYFTGDVDAPDAIHQPVNCMHCELAPCEPVCPVAATVHDEEGINSMAYNRCIGTRYCANNCPYKVRRFNYLDFTVTGNIYRDPAKVERADIYKLQRNPNVTVRYRGVMEKCTYCTQRIEEAKVAAKRAGGDRKKVADGAVVPACAQTCPTEAITFGNINDETSKVHALKKVDRNYEMLQELNVRPRTTYLARLKNTNSELG